MHGNGLKSSFPTKAKRNLHYSSIRIKPKAHPAIPGSRQSGGQQCVYRVQFRGIRQRGVGKGETAADGPRLQTSTRVALCSTLRGCLNRNFVHSVQNTCSYLQQGVQQRSEPRGRRAHRSLPARYHATRPSRYQDMPHSKLDSEMVRDIFIIFSVENRRTHTSPSNHNRSRLSVPLLRFL